MKPNVDTAQTEWELDRLLEIVKAASPKRILEVGIWEGGTLWHWLQIAESVTAIDDTMRPPGQDVWQVWAQRSNTELRLLHGSSRNQSIIGQAEGAYDFLFIDADHTYESVAADWTNYRPFVRDGGMVAFHDIVPRPDYGVDRLWDEIRAHHRTVSIVDGNGRFNGIGVVYL